MDLTISQEAYERYLKKKESIGNKRLRPENQTFIDALLSVDMTATPERRETLEAIKKLKPQQLILSTANLFFIILHW